MPRLPTAPDACYGLDEAAAYAPCDGAQAAPTAGPQAAWYFAGERVAVPSSGGAPCTRAMRPLHDLRQWSAAHASAPCERPPLVWIGDAERVDDARLDAAAGTVEAGGARVRLRLAPRLPGNSAWFDGSSAAYFAQGTVALRGRSDSDGFVASALLPGAWRLGPAPPPPRALPPAASPGLALRALLRERDAAGTAFEAHTLWSRRREASWAGKALVAFVLNGAQGDDDEAHAGHLSIATGRVAGDGSLAAWLVDSFYALDLVSEKGILAAPVPFDRYQGDVNSGQAWYRPSWALVAVLDHARAAQRVQSALGRLYRQFWRGQLAYRHTTDNCTSIATDTLRALGLDVPRAGPTARLRAWLALPWLALAHGGLGEARQAYEYLVAERTRLLPAVALEAVFESLWGLAHAPAGDGALARELGADLAGLAWLALPQYPSSRARGSAPAVSIDEIRARVPADPARRQIIPLAPRPLPEALRDDDLLPPLPRPSDVALRWWAFAPLAVAALVLALRGR